MAVDALNHLIKLNDLKNGNRIPGPGRAAKLPPAADFAGSFTSP
jgi:hypothetical protein